MWQGLSVAGAECGGMWQSGQGLSVTGAECGGMKVAACGNLGRG
jgi:hypothetical protein